MHASQIGYYAQAVREDFEQERSLSRRTTRSIPRSSHRPGLEVDAEVPVVHFHLLLVRRWAGLVGQVILR